jgi:CRISPR-associated protein Cas8a1/Csx13
VDTELTIDLFAPGMGPLHRAGLGGLAATARWINDKGPAGRRPPGSLDYDDRRVRLAWGRPEGAAEFFRALYELAFGLEGGLIHLPGGYEAIGPRVEVKAALQQGMSLTILQFGPNRKASGPPIPRRYEVDDQVLEVEHQNLVDYTHRNAWKDLVTPRGVLRPRVAVSGTIAPGFVQRHVAFPATVIEQPPSHAVALHFALVGTIALAVDRRTGVLIVPDVEDLVGFAERRGTLTPRTARECRVAGAADAALQAHVRVRQERAAAGLALRRCLAVLFATQAWNEKQKSRAAVLDVAPDPTALRRFRAAMQQLPPRVVRPAGQEPFWADSVIRPLVAENLARGRPWFEDFRRLVVAPDGSTDDAKVKQLSYEREGLKAMTEEPWEDRGEEQLVRAVHEAMGWRFHAIKRETGYDPKTKANKDAYWNRRDRQMQRWRLAFAGAKTPDDVRDALTDLWSRSAPNAVLRQGWVSLLPVLCDDRRWKLNRDLALLALASYSGPKPAENGDAGVPPVEAEDED